MPEPNTGTPMVATLKGLKGSFLKWWAANKDPLIKFVRDNQQLVIIGGLVGVGLFATLIGGKIILNGVAIGLLTFASVAALTWHLSRDNKWIIPTLCRPSVRKGIDMGFYVLELGALVALGVQMFIGLLVFRIMQSIAFVLLDEVRKVEEKEVALA